ncbi:hypothetical protein [Anaerobacillus sp. 1_MG-2023]|uniref:hypothetical protein n=1 Tax=Anaerobacillus sp. 1_MG-2023 TaxID=3062655 RepID=UPI0026E30D5C|nr:hypothetical protein [Anaerobacillus sp. 1_MG-2023]MDO6657426.1 hypothetical protein [Anaerobacillus sp. 1_MG-2023]
MSVSILFKLIPYVLYGITFILAITSAKLVYSGMSSQTERIQTRLRIKQSMRSNREKVIQSVNQSSLEERLKIADYPLGFNAFRYYILFGLILSFLIVNYIIVPIILNGKYELFGALMVTGIFVILQPWRPLLIGFILKRLAEYKQTKRNAEVFMLYDLLINELDMMEHSRINAYSILRNIQPYFEMISTPFNKLLTGWSTDEGPSRALETFAKELGTKEARTLVSVLKTLDEVERETALQSLRGMNNMFARNQIENYRRRRKVTTDFASMPIKITHFLIVLNFLVVIIVMVNLIMGKSGTI